MKVESIVLGSIGTNCYIVTNEETKECFAVDMAECPQEYVNYINNNGGLSESVARKIFSQIVL